jgi:hypothetical protein
LSKPKLIKSCRAEEEEEEEEEEVLQSRGVFNEVEHQNSSTIRSGLRPKWQDV